MEFKKELETELRKKLDAVESEQQNIMQFRDIEQNIWYEVLECSDLKDGVYGKYFIMDLLNIENDEEIKVFSITKLIHVKNLVGKYIKYKGLKEKKNKPGKFFYDVSIIDIHTDELLTERYFY